MIDTQAKIVALDAQKRDKAIVAGVAPTFFYGEKPRRSLDFCQEMNEAMALTVAESGGRLLGLCSLPMQDPELAAQDLTRAVNHLCLVGAQVGTHAQNRPIDGPEFLWSTASQLEVPILLHPYFTQRQPSLMDFYLTNLIGHPLATTVAGARLILSGLLGKYSGLRMVLLHGGGLLPYQIGRLEHGYRVRLETRRAIQEPPSSWLSRLYFDTITHSAPSLKFLVELVGPDNILLGTDAPFDMQDNEAEKNLEGCGLPPEWIGQICGGNAARLFGLATPRKP